MSADAASGGIAAVVLAAGRASRFGAGSRTSKVYALLDGRPLVAHVVAAARSSLASPIVVVTGQAGGLAAAALHHDAPDLIVANPDFATGMASSLRVGLAALPATVAGALVLLADMPLVAPSTLDALIRRFAEEPCDAVVPCFDGRPGNPVLIARGLFAAVMRLGGDAGARTLLKEAGRKVLDCPVEDAGVLVDVDTPEALAALRPR